MNLQQILQPLDDFFMWTFGLLEYGENYVNWALILIIAAALAYWNIKLAGFEKEEVANR